MVGPLDDCVLGRAIAGFGFFDRFGSKWRRRPRKQSHHKNNRSDDRSLSQYNTISNMSEEADTANAPITIRIRDQVRKGLGRFPPNEDEDDRMHVFSPTLHSTPTSPAPLDRRRNFFQDQENDTYAKGL